MRSYTLRMTHRLTDQTTDRSTERGHLSSRTTLFGLCFLVLAFASALVSRLPCISPRWRLQCKTRPYLSPPPSHSIPYSSFLNTQPPPLICNSFPCSVAPYHTVHHPCPKYPTPIACRSFAGQNRASQAPLPLHRSPSIPHPPSPIPRSNLHTSGPSPALHTTRSFSKFPTLTYLQYQYDPNKLISKTFF